MRKLIIFLNLLTAGIPVGAFAGLESLMYWPSIHRDAQVYRPNSQDVSIKAENEKQISGVFTPATKQPSQGIVVFFHGNSGNVDGHYNRSASIAGDQYDHLIFDYQGFGKSEGDANLLKMVADGRSAIRWAHQKRPELPLYVMGHSLGGAVALKSAATVKDEVSISGVAVQNSFHSYDAAAQAVLEKAHIGLIHWVGQFFFNNEESPEAFIPKLSPIPLLIVHGEMDKKVPFVLGEKIYDLAQEPKAFCPVFEGQHEDDLGPWVLDKLNGMGTPKSEVKYSDEE